MVEDEDLLLAIDAQVVASRARIARNEGELLHVLRIANIRDDHSEQRLRVVITGEIRNTVVNTHRVESGTCLGTWPSLRFRPRSSFGHLEVALTYEFKALHPGIFLEVLEGQAEAVDARRDRNVLDSRRDHLGRARRLRTAQAWHARRCPPAKRRRAIAFLRADLCLLASIIGGFRSAVQTGSWRLHARRPAHLSPRIASTNRARARKRRTIAAAKLKVRRRDRQT